MGIPKNVIPILAHDRYRTFAATVNETKRATLLS